MAHEDLGLASTKHPGGCLTRHQRYKEGNPCSHRWQAAERARAEKKIYPQNDAIKHWKDADKVKEYQQAGKLSSVGPMLDGKQCIAIKPFATCWWPWKNEAHHIVPRAVLADAIETVSSMAGSRRISMRNMVVVSLLTEKYNLNGKLNMIMLPMKVKTSEETGLPIHFGGHPLYSDALERIVNAKFLAAYRGPAEAVKTSKHRKKEKMPEVRDFLEKTATTVYKSILAQAETSRGTAIVLDNFALPF